MKKLIVFLSILLLISCDTSTNDNENSSFDETVPENTPKEWKCGTHNGKTLWTGPKGGCYYKNSNGNKTYVNRSECNC